MKCALILMLAALPLAAGDWDDDHRWKLDEKETIRRTFDAASGSGGNAAGAASQLNVPLTLLLLPAVSP